MIKTVAKRKSGDVVVYDENEQHMPEYEGKYEDVRSRILADAPPEAEFYNEDSIKPISREKW